MPVLEFEHLLICQDKGLKEGITANLLDKYLFHQSHQIYDVIEYLMNPLRGILQCNNYSL